MRRKLFLYHYTEFTLTFQILWAFLSDQRGIFRLTLGRIAGVYQLETTTARELKKEVPFLERQSGEWESLNSLVGTQWQPAQVAKGGRDTLT